MPTPREELIHDVELNLTYSGSGLPGEHPFTHEIKVAPRRPDVGSERNWGATSTSPRDALQQALDRVWGAFEGTDIEKADISLTMTVIIKPDKMPFVQPGEPYPRKNV